jgi:hypothetical protein
LGPLVWQTPSALQAAGASQTTASAPVQTPPWQELLPVQGLSSSHRVPSGWFSPSSQAPVAGLQVPPVAQSLLVQLIGFVPWHTPAPSQVSVWVQALSSLQALPSSWNGFEHSPVLGSQTPAS